MSSKKDTPEITNGGTPVTNASNSNGPERQTAAPAYLAMMQRARKIDQFTEKWEGLSPAKMDSSLDPNFVEQFEITDLLGHEVTIFGYSLRSGQHGEFVVVSCVPQTGRIATFVTGGAVIIKKLKRVAELNGFPVVGTIVKPEDKAYYDFVGE